ncbi:hypothetical protein [Rubrivirga sp. IMCC45206]|uniref:hypothetical protein n=1 Tax=Rubrivirga sp. IMCC45206 TaxID=3391614 RepID=UPI00398FDD24
MRALLVPLLLLVACGPDPAEPPAPPAPPDAPAPSVTAPPAAPDTLRLSIDDRALADRPTAPVRVDGACPFEGCVYGEWTTTAETTVYAVGGDTTRVAFTVPAGTVLAASGGFALVTRVGQAVVVRPAELYQSGAETRPLAVGDTLAVLDYEGEGSHRVWIDGEIGFSEAGADVGPPGEGPAIRQTVAPAVQWWARVAAPDGRAGWLWMDRTPRVEGADALG